MNLSKAFECILHDLIIAKLAAYGIDRENLRMIYSYLKRRKQCVKINNAYSDYSSAPQGSILEPILFSFQLMIFFSSPR